MPATTTRDSVEQLLSAVRRFATDRDWEPFHTPKNLAAALSVEAAELLEHFQWLTPEESAQLAGEKLQRVADEIGDVLIYLVRLADVLGLDPIHAAHEKLAKNAAKYPAERVRGKALKYSEYDE